MQEIMTNNVAVTLQNFTRKFLKTDRVSNC